jgi:hypothetical protein
MAGLPDGVGLLKMLRGGENVLLRQMLERERRNSL